MATATEAYEIARALRHSANSSISFSKQFGTTNGVGATVMLRVMRETKGDFVRLWGKQGGPRGRVVRWDKGQTIAQFDAHAILAAADKLEQAAEAMTP